jgi:Glycosyltransferase family 87
MTRMRHVVEGITIWIDRYGRFNAASSAERVKNLLSALRKEPMATELQRRVERGIWIYLACFFFLMAFAWGPFLVHWRMKIFLPFLAHWPRLAYFPLGSLGERFGDLAHFASVHQKLANPLLGDADHLTGSMFPRNYGPVAVLLYLFLLGFCSPYGIVVFLSIFIGSLSIASFVFWRAARRAPGYRPFMALAIFGTSLLGFPTQSTIIRGNIEGLLWVGYAAGIGYMFSRKWGKSASILAIASCIKPYPLFFFVCLLLRRKYKQVVLGAFVFFITIVGCLTLLGKGNPQRGAERIRGGSDIFFANYIVGFRAVTEMVGDHSLFQTSKSIVRVMKARGFNLPEKDYEYQPSLRAGYILLAMYLPAAALSVAWVLWKIRKKPFLTQIFAMSICLTLFTLLAADYTMTILYIPMGLFLLFLVRDVATGRVPFSQSRILSILVPCALLMVPLPLFSIWAGDLRSIILLCLLLIVVATPMPMAIDLGEAHTQEAEIAMSRH